MTTGVDDAATVSFVSKWAGAAIAAVGSAFIGVLSWVFGRVVKKHDDEIDNIKGSLKKLQEDMSEVNQKLPEGYTPIERFEALEERTRQSVIALHSKVENVSQNLGNKIDAGNAQIMSILTRRRT